MVWNLAVNFTKKNWKWFESIWCIIAKYMKQIRIQKKKNEKWNKEKEKGRGGTIQPCRRGETTYAMGWLKWGPS
jgi:hypothetical protein